MSKRHLTTEERLRVALENIRRERDTLREDIKSQAQVAVRIMGERDSFRDTVEQQQKSINEQRKVIADSWAEARELRNRLSALELILAGAVQVARMPQMTLGQCDLAMSPESPR
jgi:septal ring factor EnvC (AmiA/AmiB activator)